MTALQLFNLGGGIAGIVALWLSLRAVRPVLAPTVVEKVTLGPDDAVVVRVPNGVVVAPGQVANLKDYVVQQLGQRPVLVLQHGMSIEVLARSDSPCA